MELKKVHIAMTAGGLIVFALALIPLFGNVEARLSEMHTDDATMQTAQQQDQAEWRPRDIHSRRKGDGFSGFGTRRTVASVVNTVLEISNKEVSVATVVAEEEVEVQMPTPTVAKSEPKITVDTDEQITHAETETVTEDVEEVTVVETETEEARTLETEPVLTKSLSEDEQAFLTLHNDVRDKHGLPAFTWSDNLASGAADWADTLASESCEMRHSDEPYGENLFILWSTSASVEGTPEDAVTWWADEEKYYSYDTDTCENGEVCGHYTQMVWEETTELGCARTRCSEPGKTTDLFVCRYSPQGNIIGEKPY